MENVKTKVLAIVEESMLALASGVLTEDTEFNEYDALYELKKALLETEDYELLEQFYNLEVKYDLNIKAHQYYNI